MQTTVMLALIPTDLVFYLFAIPAVLLAGISKAGFGGVTGGLAVVAMAQVVSPAKAAAIMMPILCVMDIFGVRAYWQRINWALLKRMLPAAVIGTLIGALTWKLLNVAWLKVLLGGIAVGFPLWWWLKPEAPAPDAGASNGRSELLKASAWCGLSGFTSFVAHAGGPPVLAYLLPKQLDKSVQVGTMSFFFLIVNYAKLPQYIAVGQITPEVLMITLVLAPFIPIGVGMGLALHDRIPHRAFQLTCQILMFVMGLKLLLEALAALRG